MSINILAFDGDGIGPEIMKSTLDVVELLNEKLKLDIDIKKEIIGFKSLEQKGTTFTDDALIKAKKSRWNYFRTCKPQCISIQGGRWYQSIWNPSNRIRFICKYKTCKKL